jgi:UPF0755 protein
MKMSRFAGCLILLSVLVCLVAGSSYFLYRTMHNRVVANFGHPTPGLSLSRRLWLETTLVLNGEQIVTPTLPGGAEIDFSIEPGESTSTILARLWEAGLISDPAALSSYLQYAGLDTNLQAGDYVLSPGMTPREIALEMQDATPETINFRILPGWRLEEIADAMPTSGFAISPEVFLSAASPLPTTHILSNFVPEGASTEGFLFPGVYEIDREATASQLVNLFLDRFAENIPEEMLDGFERQGLSLYEAVILAAIVERESKVDEEKPLIASVFLNRLAAGIKLDADPTVQYALGYQRERGGWWPSPLSLRDLETNSLYNTYQYGGLPPGPIANPGLASLRAVAFPAQTPYYYFRAACDGSGEHVFAETFQQHLNNACP